MYYIYIEISIMLLCLVYIDKVHEIMKLTALLPYIIILPLIANYSQETITDNESIDELITAVTESCNSVYSGKGSFTYKYKDVSDMLLSGKNIDLAKKEIDLWYYDKSGEKGSTEIYHKNCMFYKNMIKYEFGNSKNEIKYNAVCYSDGIKIRKMNISYVYPESLISISEMKKQIMNLPQTHGDPAVCDPLFFPSKKILWSFSLYKDLKLDIRKVSKETYKGKKYTVISFGVKNSYEKFYIDSKREHKVFVIKKYTRDFKSTKLDITRIDYQSLCGKLFPKHISEYIIKDDYIIDVKELDFNNDWKLNKISKKEVLDSIENQRVCINGTK
jgi:hypothetical protein